MWCCYGEERSKLRNNKIYFRVTQEDNFIRISKGSMGNVASSYPSKHPLQTIVSHKRHARCRLVLNKANCNLMVSELRQHETRHLSVPHPLCKAWAII